MLYDSTSNVWKLVLNSVEETGSVLLVEVDENLVKSAAEKRYGRNNATGLGKNWCRKLCTS